MADHQANTSASQPTGFVEPSLHSQVYAPLDAQILDWLDLLPGARVLDAGCGAGEMAARFAGAVGAAGAVVAVDGSPDALALARQAVATSPAADRVTLREANLLALPLDSASFDLAWCSYVLHHISDPVAAAHELRRVVRPGGRIVVRETGMPLRALPFDLGIGAPGFEDRLRVAHNRWFANHRYATPVEQPYPYGWMQVLREAGCRDITAHTFLLELQPPLTPAQQDWLVETFRKSLDDHERRQFLDAEDQATLAALTDPVSPHYMLKRPDLHVLSGISLFIGLV
jgi:ubiquinone/menaquinone biosynthesis C-methylase UbiE